MNRIIFILFLLIFNICHNSNAANFFNKRYGDKSFIYNTELGQIEQSTNITQGKKYYRIGLIFDSPFFDTPITGFLYKILYLSKAMAGKGHTYVFFVCNRNFKTKQDIDNFKLHGIKVHVLDKKLFYDVHYMDTLVKKEGINILQYELAQTFLSLGVPLKIRNNLPTVLTLHDIEADLVEQLKQYHNKDILDYTHYVASNLTDVLLTLTTSDKNKRIQQHSISPEKIYVTPIGIDQTYLHKRTRLPQGKIIGLVGNQFYEPNKRASIFLIEKVLPIVKRRFPEARVKIVGMVPDNLKASYLNREDVIFTGAIEDKEKYLRELASFSVGTCCIDRGTGMNVKVSNYCAVGLPVVLTKLCYKGYENINSLKISSFNPEQIAYEINKIFEDEEGYASKLGQQNQTLIFKHLSWEIIANKFEEALNYAYMSHRLKYKVKLNPIWMDEKRHPDDILKGHYVIDK